MVEMGAPAECYVPVVEGQRWYQATYNTEEGRPAVFFYFPEEHTGHNFTRQMEMNAQGEVEITQEHHTYRDGSCGCVEVYFNVHPSVIMAFFRAHNITT